MLTCSSPAARTARRTPVPAADRRPGAVPGPALAERTALPRAGRGRAAPRRRWSADSCWARGRAPGWPARPWCSRCVPGWPGGPGHRGLAVPARVRVRARLAVGAARPPAADLLRRPRSPAGEPQAGAPGDRRLRRAAGLRQGRAQRADPPLVRDEAAALRTLAARSAAAWSWCRGCSVAHQSWHDLELAADVAARRPPAAPRPARATGRCCTQAVLEIAAVDRHEHGCSPPSAHAARPARVPRRRCRTLELARCGAAAAVDRAGRGRPDARSSGHGTATSTREPGGRAVTASLVWDWERFDRGRAGGLRPAALRLPGRRVTVRSRPPAEVAPALLGRCRTDPGSRWASGRHRDRSRHVSTSSAGGPPAARPADRGRCPLGARRPVAAAGAGDRHHSKGRPRSHGEKRPGLAGPPSRRQGLWIARFGSSVAGCGWSPTS